MEFMTSYLYSAQNVPGRISTKYNNTEDSINDIDLFSYDFFFLLKT